MCTDEENSPVCNGRSVIVAYFPKERYSHAASNSLIKIRRRMKTLNDYLEQYALISLEKRDKLASMVGENLHELDLDAGIIRFSRDLAFPFQVLGTESDNSLTWLWAWAEEQTEIPEMLIQASLDLRHWGAQEGLREFTIPSIDLTRADGNAVAMVSTQISQANSYFRDSYEGGAAYLLIFENSIDNEPSFDRASLLRHLSDIIARYDLNHRNLLWSYLQMKRVSAVEQGPLITCELETGERLIAEFDDAGKLSVWNGERVADL